MPISALVQRLRPTLNDPSFPSVAAWKQEGGASPGRKAVGCFPVYTPQELIHASGMLPVTVAGAAGRVKLDRADGFLQAFVCLIGRSTLELELEGQSGGVGLIDGMLFPSTCEISRGLAGVWARSRRGQPDKPVLYIHFPQNLESAHAAEYLLGELHRVKTALEELAGAEITDDRLRNSFRVYNERRERLEELDRLRAERPPRLSASEFYILRLAGMTIPPEDHIALLTEAIEAVRDTGDGGADLAGRESPIMRMALTGAFCENPPIAMLEVIEEAGVAIVSDDILLGQRWWTAPIPALAGSGDPLVNLAEHYLHHAVFSSVVHRPPEALSDAIRSKVKETHADGVIIATAKFCHPALHDIACIARTCEEEGIPYLKLEFEEDMKVFESIRVQVEALIEARERLPFAGTN